MSTYLVTRHSGAKDWFVKRGFVGEFVEHFDVSCVQEGDVVVGTLPVHLASDVVGRGGEYWHLVLDIPAELRGKELTAAGMDACGATVSRFYVLDEDTYSQMLDDML